MSSVDSLYSSLKPEIEALASPLFDASELFVRNRGAFLPHGAVLTQGGEVRLVAAAPADFETRALSATEVLPLLHQALQAAAIKEGAVAVAVSEDVTITPEGQKPTKAIKVLVEHKRGLTVALYLPFHRKLLKGYVFGAMLVLPASPEVCAWPSGIAT
jgi:hypothetical protein